jgi:hypothetical protein
MKKLKLEALLMNLAMTAMLAGAIAAVFWFASI